MSTTSTGIGASVRRREDFKFLRGTGRYTDDMSLPNQTYCFFIRSNVAHARIKGIDKTKAEQAHGVVAVLTGEDFTSVGGMPCGWLITGKGNKPMIEPRHPILAHGKVRHVGDPVVAVIAESLSQAKDAAEMVVIEYDSLPAVVDMAKALQGGTAVHDEAADNMCYDWELGDKAATDAAFAKAAHVTKIDIVNQRLVANAM